jgi:DNA-binding transcriptional LysR family regulator
MKHSLPMGRGLLDALLVFRHVAELRNFRAAARLLGISPSAVSQSVRALEARLGVPLLARTTRAVGLTEAGQRLLSHVRPAVDMLGSGLDAAMSMGRDVSGVLRLNVPRPLLPLLAERLLPDFCLAYPSLQLELYAEDRLIDIVEQGFDAGIRLGDLVASDMVAIRLTPPFRLLVVGTPTYFAAHGHPRTPQDLQQHRCVQLRMTSEAMYNWEFVVDGQPLSVAVGGPMIVNDADLNLRAALTGLALAYVPEPSALFHIAGGQLVATLEAFSITEPGLMLYFPSRARALPKLRAFIDFARDKMRRDFEATNSLVRASTSEPREKGRKVVRKGVSAVTDARDDQLR